MSSPSPLLTRIRAVAEVLELAPAHVAALLALASLACAGVVGLWWTGRPEQATPPPVLSTEGVTPASGGVAAPGSAPAPLTAASGGTFAPPTAAPVAGDVVVHVSGAVASEGVVELPGGARVVDALEAVGGPRPTARTDQLNLARPVQDGEQVHVPTGREVRAAGGGAVGTAGVGRGSVAVAGGGSVTTEAAPGPAISLNRATATELEALPGVGPVLAQRLVEHRTATGGFTSVDELLEIEGIGEKTLAELRDHVSL